MLIEVTQDGKRYFLETYKTYVKSFKSPFFDLITEGVPEAPESTFTEEEQDMFQVLFKIIWYKEPRKATRAMMQGIGTTNFKSVPIDMDTLLSEISARGVISYDRAKRAVLGLYESLFITNAESEEYD